MDLHAEQCASAFTACAEVVTGPFETKEQEADCANSNNFEEKLILQVSVPPESIDAIFPRVRRLLEVVHARNVRMQSGKGQADYLTESAFQNPEVNVSPLAACLLTNPTILVQAGIWTAQTPSVTNIIMTQEYLQSAQQVLPSHEIGRQRWM